MYKEWRIRVPLFYLTWSVMSTGLLSAFATLFWRIPLPWICICLRWIWLTPILGTLSICLRRSLVMCIGTWRNLMCSVRSSLLSGSLPCLDELSRCRSSSIFGTFFFIMEKLCFLKLLFRFLIWLKVRLLN